VIATKEVDLCCRSVLEIVTAKVDLCRRSGLEIATIEVDFVSPERTLESSHRQVGITDVEPVEPVEPEDDVMTVHDIVEEEPVRSEDE
jgi:hypothetical protein